MHLLLCLRVLALHCGFDAFGISVQIELFLLYFSIILTSLSPTPRFGTPFPYALCDQQRKTEGGNMVAV